MINVVQLALCLKEWKPSLEWEIDTHTVDIEDSIKDVDNWDSDVYSVSRRNSAIRISIYSTEDG